MADNATVRLSEHIKERGIKVSSISRATGIAYGRLQRSLLKCSRSLTADEYLKVCKFVGYPICYSDTERKEDE